MRCLGEVPTMFSNFTFLNNTTENIFVKSQFLSLMQTKTLVIHGLNDMILPLPVGEHLHKSLKNSEFHVIPYSSHQVFQEEPEKVAKLILEFIDK